MILLKKIVVCSIVACLCVGHFQAIESSDEGEGSESVVECRSFPIGGEECDSSSDNYNPCFEYADIPVKEKTLSDKIQEAISKLDNNEIDVKRMISTQDGETTAAIVKSNEMNNSVILYFYNNKTNRIIRKRSIFFPVNEKIRFSEISTDHKKVVGFRCVHNKNSCFGCFCKSEGYELQKGYYDMDSGKFVVIDSYESLESTFNYFSY
jgi:hypothetical protein